MWHVQTLAVPSAAGLNGFFTALYQLWPCLGFVQRLLSHCAIPINSFCEYWQ